MKPLNLIALLLFLGGAVWALTRSDRAVREIQNAYYSAMSPFLKSGSKLETQARAFLTETRHSKELETELETIRQEFGRLRLMESRFRALEYENAQLRHALDFKKATNFEVVAARVIRRNPTTWWQTVEIDAGSKRGIGTQLAVLSNEGLVGIIDRVDNSGDRSSVLLADRRKMPGRRKSRGLSGSRHPQRPARRLRRRSDAAPPISLPQRRPSTAASACSPPAAAAFSNPTSFLEPSSPSKKAHWIPKLSSGPR